MIVDISVNRLRKISEMLGIDLEVAEKIVEFLKDIEEPAMESEIILAQILRAARYSGDREQFGSETLTILWEAEKLEEAEYMRLGIGCVIPSEDDCYVSS